MGGAADEELEEEGVGAGVAGQEEEFSGAVAGYGVGVVLPVVPTYFGD